VAALHALVPVRVPVPELVRRSDVGALAWAGMCRDGTVAVLWGDVAVAAGLDVSPIMRLAAVADVVPARGVVGRASAAWVHLGGPAPSRVDVLVPPRGRRTDPDPWRSSAEAPLPAEDVLTLGRTRVTTVQRTGLDVARWLPAPVAAVLLEGLCGLGFDPAAARARLEEVAGGRGLRQARELLGRL